MTINLETPTFRGVNCLHCKAPIPVPAIVRNAPAGQDSGDASGRRSQVFNLRCRYCHKEKPYRMSEIVDFEGQPEDLLAVEHAAPVRWSPQPGLARTAKA